MWLDEVGPLRTLTAYRVIIDRLIASHRGRIFNTAGDSLVADFAIAVDAVQCAVAVQKALAEPGGICVSGTLRDQIGTKLDLGFGDLGPQQVKNITQPIQAYRIGA